eukprot:1158718-Pelagomonas_calceolata.AAC.7
MDTITDKSCGANEAPMRPGAEDKYMLPCKRSKLDLSLSVSFAVAMGACGSCTGCGEVEWLAKAFRWNSWPLLKQKQVFRCSLHPLSPITEAWQLSVGTSSHLCACGAVRNMPFPTAISKDVQSVEFYKKRSVGARLDVWPFCVLYALIVAKAALHVSNYEW